MNDETQSKPDEARPETVPGRSRYPLLGDVDALCYYCLNGSHNEVKATHEILFTNINRSYYACDEHLQEQEEIAEETNRHEMDRFNGEYGLVTYDIRKL